MKKNDLENLFSDTKLLPNKKFEKELLIKLSTKKKQRTRLPMFAKIGVVFAVATLLIGVSLLRPFQNEIGDSVLLRDLYARALADELPRESDTTNWFIIEKTSYSNQAKVCFQQNGGVISSVLLDIYDDGQQSAYLRRDDYLPIEQSQGYSSDPEIPAYDTSLFSGASSIQLRSLLAGAQLTGEDGKLLAKDATTPKKTSGTYNIYAAIDTPKTDTKNYIEGCSKLRFHITLDAAMNVVQEIRVYNQTTSTQITDENLAVIYKTIITQENRSFNEFVDKITVLGFNIDIAKANNTTNTYLTLDNTQAGYSVRYDKAIFGTLTVREIRTNNGKIAGYTYLSSKQPEATYTIYTKDAESVPDLRNKIKANKLRVLSDTNESGIILRDYGEVTLTVLIAEDENKLYGLSSTGSSDIPYVYYEGPRALGQKIAATPEQSLEAVQALLRILVFTPGSDSTRSDAL